MSNMIHKTHFALSKHNYEERVKSGAYNTEWGNLDYVDITPPSYKIFRPELERVGAPWGWNLMDDRFGEEAMKTKLTDPETRLRLLRENEQVIGYALILGVEKSLSDKFWKSSNNNKIIEIENLGLYPSSCGNGKGWSFFEMQFADLFEDYDTIYWSMSSSNHPTLGAFYERMGMEVLARELIADPRAAIPEVKKHNFG